MIDRTRRMDPKESSAIFQSIFNCHGAPGPTDERLEERTFLVWRVVRILGQAIGHLTLGSDVASFLEVRDHTGKPLHRGPVLPQYGVQRTSQNMPFLRAYTQGMAMFPSSNHALAAEFAQMAQMALATVRDPDAKALQDDMVLTDLTVPEHVQNSDVTAEMVCDLESTLIARTLAHILEPSDRGKTTLKVLMGEGLTLDEATVLINLAKRRLAEARASTSVEEDRALLVQRYEDLASRSAASMSLLDELRALKELARVLGVTQVQRAGDEVDFSRVIEAADKDEEADILRLGDGSEDEDGDDDDWDDD